jgi:N-acetylneuraminic acid mutarotase
MIVWGGHDDNYSDLNGDTNTGGQYHPSTDRWTATSIVNAPSRRQEHAAVWTGTEMIVWGGNDYFGGLHTGGKYNPVTNSWRATSTVHAPSNLYRYTAVWTGTQMIIWGAHMDGFGNLSNVGRRFNPATNTWIGMSTTNPPSARANHTAVWTGTEMIVWGGCGDFSNPDPFTFHCEQFLNSGGRYNPSTNSWIHISSANAPTGRSDHTAVWTGSAMIIWGGYDSSQQPLNTGGKYRPATNTWTTVSTVNAPAEAHTTVWTGSEMIAWGGPLSAYGAGGRYNPVTNSWRSTSTINAPSSRSFPTAVWTGSEMIVWGGDDPLFGYSDSGGIYCAQ